MPSSSNGGRNGGKNNGKKSNPVLENLREACPPHKRKDLDKIYKAMNGDEAKIMEKIQQWWEEPAEQEEVWEDVNKKNTKKKQDRGGRGGGRNQGPGRGRGRGGGGRGGGGGGRDRGGRGDRGRGPTGKKESKDSKADNGQKTEQQPAAAQQAGIPAPVDNAPGLKGAWGARAAAPAPAAPSAATEPPKTALQPKAEETTKPPETNPLDVGLPSQSDPTPAGLSARDAKPVVRAVPAGGNVWATKGSAHLIQAEKPKPVPVAPPAPAPAAPAPVVEPEPEPEPTPAPSVAEPTLESGLPSTITGGGAWGKPAPTQKSETSAAPIAMPPAAPTVPIPPTPVEETVPVVAPETKAAPPPPSPATPANVLNMGQWETGDVSDSQGLDFGFGSFGADNDAVVEASTSSAVASSPATSKEPESQKTTVAATVSPARPPPGLSLGGMPPMPESAVMVHELENKMEGTSLNAAPQKEQTEAKPITSSLPTQAAPAQAAQAAVLPGAGLAQQSYNQYGMPGMYNYNAAGSGFVGMGPAGPVLAGGVVPQQPGKPQAGGIGQPAAAGPTATPQTLPQQGLYGNQPPPAPSSGNAATDASADNSTPTPTTAAAGIPPGMPGAIPYANPALAAHYGQQHFYMGQHQGGIGYNYGYGQFGGVAQGGFGYQQVMGQNQGYGAPHYDDHSQQNSHQTGGSGGYHKNSGGGYRGRNNHHNNNQYQNQYNPQQHGGYGGQPYGMGYHGDHFNQRGGYGPGGMGDPYGMQQGMHSGGFQDDDHKGKKAGRGANSSLQQYQQAPPHQVTQQGFGLQGQGTDPVPSSGAGGWSNNQAGGWSGGAPSWQGNN